jgi:hypothetical protein
MHRRLQQEMRLPYVVLDNHITLKQSAVDPLGLWESLRSCRFAANCDIQTAKCCQSTAKAPQKQPALLLPNPFYLCLTWSVIHASNGAIGKSLQIWPPLLASSSANPEKEFFRCSWRVGELGPPLLWCFRARGLLG